MSILRFKDPTTKEWKEVKTVQGPKGETPVKGVDYWTEEDKQEIIDSLGTADIDLANYYTKAEIDALLTSLDPNYPSAEEVKY